jgi:hypothetical protein
LPTGYVPDATDKTLLTFKSTRILRTGNSKFDVIGDLTLTRVERTVTAEPTEGYAGPEYGDPVIHAGSREIKFQFSTLSAAFLPGPLTPAMLQNKGAQEIVGAAGCKISQSPNRDKSVSCKLPTYSRLQTEQ